MIIFCLVLFFPYREYHGDDLEFKVYDDNLLRITSNAGSIVLMFYGVSNFHQSFKALKVKTEKRGTKIGTRAVSLVTILSLIFGYTAYFSHGQKELLKIELYPERPELNSTTRKFNVVLKACKSV